MTPQEHLRLLITCTLYGPICPFFGMVGDRCECNRPRHPKTHKKFAKHPHRKALKHWGKNWFNKATTNPDQLAKWLADYPDANFAVMCFYVIVVLDLDVKPGKDGVAELRLLEEAAGEPLKETITVISGSGGEHRYFRYPVGLVLKRPPSWKDIDLLHTKKQDALLPGSRNEAGTYYFKPGFGPGEVELADLPQWMLDLLAAPETEPKKPRSTGSTAGGTDDIKKLFAEMLANGPPEGSRAPGRRRSDSAVKFKMKDVPTRRYPDDLSHSD